MTSSGNPPKTSRSNGRRARGHRDWLEFLDNANTVDELYECEGTGGGCDGEVLTVPCHAFEFSATYINMQVYYGLRASNHEEFDQEQAAESYGAVFSYVAETLPRESE
jgi:hypothetical protein